MKTSLTVLSLLFAAAVPSAFALEFIGVHLPAGLDPLNAIAGFAAAFVLLTVTGDYRRRSTFMARTCVVAAKAEHPLAA